MTEVSATSTFGERFLFARDRQRARGRWRPDTEFAGIVGVLPSQITEYKARSEAPPANRVLVMARDLEVDPGWLSFGDDTAAPPPDGFETWMANRRERGDTIHQRVSATNGEKPGYKRVAERSGAEVVTGSPERPKAPKSKKSTRPRKRP